MTLYIAKRLFYLCIGFFVFSILLFFIGQFTVNDTITLEQFKLEDRLSSNSIQSRWKLIRSEKQKRGLDLPSFYFTIYRNSSTDTLYKIEEESIKNTLLNLAHNSGSWEKTNTYYKQVKQALFSNSINKEQKQLLLNLLNTNQIEKHRILLQQLNPAHFENIQREGEALFHTKPNWADLMAFNISWNGIKNSYHQWFSKLLKGNFGNSNSDGEAVHSKIKDALFWTIILSTFSILIALIIAIPSALLSVHPKYRTFTLFFERIFFTLYAIPNFWMATLLILFLASGTYLSLLPVYGLGYVAEDSSTLSLLTTRVWHLILPIFCLTYGSIAYSYKQLKEALLQELNKEYVKTALSKGLSYEQLIRKHLLKNALFPLITIVGGLLPVLISGSFIVENIFAIPGMGKLTLNAYYQRDLSVIFSVLMITYLLTSIGFILADVFYQWNDPRVNFQQRKITK